MPDTPPTNIEIRRWYYERVTQIRILNQQWTNEGVPLAERAFRAFTIRHTARLQARAMMSNRRLVRLLERRDAQKYGNPDGPTFQYLFDRNAAKGLGENDNYEKIILTASRTDADTNEMLWL